MPIPIILTLLFLVGYVIHLVIKNHKKEERPKEKRESDSSGKEKPSPTPKGKWVYGWLWWPTTIATAIVLTWGFSTSWGKNRVVTNPATSTGMQTVQPKEEWVFEWSTSPNESRTFEAQIEKCDSESLWFSTPYSCGSTVRIATYILAKTGDNYIGSWSQNCPKDSGTLFLKKDGYQRYVGQITDENNTKAVITLKRK